MADPKIDVNCPLCGLALVYVRTDGDTHIYNCRRHGTILFLPDGRIRQRTV